MRALAAALTLGVLLAVAGCGGDDDAKAGPASTPTSSAPTVSGSRPTAAEIGKALIATQDGTPEGTYSVEEATCVGRVLTESKLSDESLAKIVTDLASFAPEAAEESIYRELIPLVTTCVANRVPTATPSS